MSFARNDSPSDRESKAGRAEACFATVVFLTSSKNPDEVVLCESGRIIYSNQHGNRTEARGQRAAYALSDGAQMLSLTFSWRGSEVIGDLSEHLFSQVVIGV